ncbi:MAG TPA: class I SAM-dependent methyltransferase [Vicinamibacterales bacterium]|nr:class I SAM-dependent methyltransferase [Vicinamibacterales bacterium]
MKSEWFASWFDSPYYHRLYAHRDESEASRFVDALIARLGPGAGASVLDLGCGAGRHARRLADKGLDVTGLDLAADSIRAASLHAHERLRFARHDMRVPFGFDTFDIVFNLFTSFGYFERAEEHLAVVRNVSASLKPGGVFVLDYLNAARAAAQLTPYEAVERDGVRFRISRRADAAHIFKRIAVDAGSGAPVIEYEERVAAFSLEDFRLMFALYGLTIETVYGDYQLAPFEGASSPRLIVVASKTGGARDGDYLRDARESFVRMRLSVSGDTPRYDASIFCGTRCAIEG